MGRGEQPPVHSWFPSAIEYTIGRSLGAFGIVARGPPLAASAALSVLGAAGGTHRQVLGLQLTPGRLEGSLAARLLCSPRR